MLFDSSIHDKVWHGLAQDYFDKILTSLELEQFHGRSCQTNLEYLAGKTMGGTELDHWVNIRESLYRNKCGRLIKAGKLSLSPGATDLFEFLKTQEIDFTIATSSERGNVDFYRQYLFLDRWFNPAQIVYYDGTYPGKPAPDVYLKAASIINGTPAECIVIEDSLAGITAAKNAKIGYIIGLGPEGKYAALLNAGAHRTICDLREFPRELVNKNPSVILKLRRKKNLS